MDNIVDVQNLPDARNMPINQVGVKGLRLPLTLNIDGALQHTIAHYTMTVALPAEQKGTHMSRFVLLAEQNTAPMGYLHLKALILNMLETLDALAGKIVVNFPFFRRKNAPISGIESTLDYEVSLTAEVSERGDYSHVIRVMVPVTSLCPCSKEISRYGAHNQRSHVSLWVQCDAQVTISWLIDLVENTASCQLYGVLKRSDEKYVTEKAYENPKFVEDMVRDIALALHENEHISAFRVESENFESIHNHSAYALIEHPKGVVFA